MKWGKKSTQHNVPRETQRKTSNKKHGTVFELHKKMKQIFTNYKIKQNEEEINSRNKSNN